MLRHGKNRRYNDRCVIVIVPVGGLGKEIVLIFPSSEASECFEEGTLFPSKKALTDAIDAGVEKCKMRVSEKFNADRGEDICSDMTELMKKKCEEIEMGKEYIVISIKINRSCEVDDYQVDM